MKKFLLTLISLMVTFSSFSQVKLNIWDKSPRAAQSLTKFDAKKLPQSFISRTPDGDSVIYDKVESPDIQVETSDGKKFTEKSTYYRNRNGDGIVNYTDLGWQGYHQSNNGKKYSMSPNKLIEETKPPQIGCGGVKIPTNQVKSDSKTDKKKSPPPTGKIITTNGSADFYNRNISINKDVTLYCEVSNDLHVSLGNNTTTTTNWVKTLCAGVKEVYRREGISLRLNKIYIWTSPDPYGYATQGESSGIALDSFSKNMTKNIPTNSNSHYNALLTGKTYGGVAWLGGWTTAGDGYTLPTNYSSTPFFRSSVNGMGGDKVLSDTISLNYSWPVNLLAHEVGHNFGTNHTHWCGWLNDVGVQIGRLDSCGSGYNEQGTGPIQLCGTNSSGTTIPTIMSYCQLRGTTTNMLVNGFGKYPRFVIRSKLYRDLSIPFANVTSATLTTTAVTKIKASTLTTGGNITNDGGGPITDRGVCWSLSTQADPTISLTTRLSSGTGSGTFTINVTGLTGNTSYKIRAYAVNSSGTSYGNTITVTTGSPTLPALTTASVTSIQAAQATCGGTITSDSGAAVTSRGVCWSTSPNPTIALTTKTSNGSGTGSFTSTMTGLSGSTTYYVRAFATNSVGTSYGNQQTFTTTAVGAAVVTLPDVGGTLDYQPTTTGNPYYISSKFAYVQCSLQVAGGTISQRGVCYSTSPNPTTSNSKFVVSGTALGTFVARLSGLTSNTTYYVRAYVINNNGTWYSNEKQFKTDTKVTVNLSSASSITYNSCLLNYTLANSPTVSSTDYGNCATFGLFQIIGEFYSDPNFTNSVNPGVLQINSITTNGTYSILVSNLQGLTTYYVRLRVEPCWIDESVTPQIVDYTYSNVISFTTPNGVPPTVQTLTGSVSITSSTNTGLFSDIQPYTSFYGDVTNSNGTLSSTGLVYKTTSASLPVVGDPTVNIFDQAGPYKIYRIPSPQFNTTYYARYYATNQFGTTYSNLVTVVIGPNPSPQIIIDSVRTITTKGARFFCRAVGGVACNNTSGCKSLVLSSVVNTLNSLKPQPSEGYSPTTYLHTKFLTPNVVGQNVSYVIDFSTGNTSMLANTLYYFRGFGTGTSSVGGTISSGTNIQTFTTRSSLVPPTLSAASVSSTTTVSTQAASNVTDDGGSLITERGFVYSTTSNPTITSGTKIARGATTGPFTALISGLSPSTTYYIRSYATNSSGTNYGTQATFTTTAGAIIPTLTTTAVSNITTTSASSGGNVTSDGGSVVTSRGICYSTSPTPTTSNTVILGGSGVGSFTSNLSSLTQGQTYYIRAFAINSVGTAYGSEVSFTTQNVPQVAATTAASAITQSTATTGGNVTSDGGATITERGVCYGIFANPTIGDSKLISVGTTGTFTSNLTGLLPSTTYYVRAYAINSVGTTYGTGISFTTTAALTTPTLTTTAITSITSTSASSGGTISSDGGASITAKGVCWSTSTAPTIALSTKTSNGTGSTQFTSSITGLVPGTLYYVRAYATNSQGTSYGNELTFTTSVTLPTLATTTTATSITQTTAVSGGNVTSDGGATITERGVCWSTTTNPTIALTTKTSDGSGTGSFTSNITGLTANTLYYVRSYATNSSGTSYGTQIQFTTIPVASVPTVTTNATVTSIARTTASSGGNVTADGGASVTVRGVVWSTSANPTVALTTKTSNGTGTGAFTSSITGLTANTTYYVRAYATNSVGTGYGEQRTFTTLPNVPTLTTNTITSITSTTAVSGGTTLNAQGGTITEKGVVWGTVSNPTISLTTKTSDGTGTANFTSNITGLTPNTLYYVRAYATNAGGTGYGTQRSFTTLSQSIPTLTTTAITNVTFTSATSGGNITSDGNSPVTARGVVFSNTPSPTLSNSATSDGTGTGSFTSNLPGLTTGLTYYVRAYATNAIGTAYGNELIFTTLGGQAPTITTNSVTDLTSTSASISVTLSNDGGGLLSEKGFVYSTNPSPTVADTKEGGVCDPVTNPCDLGTYTIPFTLALTPNQTYYVRAYAINESGTSYGSEISFTTPIGIPALSTNVVSSITTSGGVSGGTNIDPIGGSISDKGVCWSTSQNPTILDSRTQDGTGVNNFTSTISGLSPNTTYYVRAYATNQTGTGYGNQVSFQTTNIGLASLTTSAASSIGTTIATSGGNITSDGGSSVTQRGVCWSTSQNPTISGNFTSDGTGTGTFTSNISGLAAGTLYYVRAYAITAAGTSYGNQISFTTSGSLATLTTNSITSITSNSAVSGGNISSSGGSSITQRGVCWSTSQNPTISGSRTTDGSGTGTFTSNISGLTASTLYYVRAYATNSSGTAYGNQVSFTTSAPVVGSCAITGLNVTSVNKIESFSFNINPSCTNYTINVCRYSNTNPSISPTVGQTPTACAIRNNNSGQSFTTPTASEILSGVISRQMSPQPANTGFWYSVDVTCNGSCSGTKTTRSAYFYNAP